VAEEKRHKNENEVCYLSSSFFQFCLTTPLSISAVADFSASRFYVFFRYGVSSTSRTSDAAVSELPSFPFSSPFQPFCCKLSRAIQREESRARIKCQIFWKCKQVESPSAPVSGHGSAIFSPFFCESFRGLNHETPWPGSRKG